MNLFFITNSLPLASFAIAHGADRIFVDLEINGKVARQGHLSTVISRHSIEDVTRMRAIVPTGTLHVRINPIHEGSFDEVEEVIAAGADVIMLPMFHVPEQVEIFTRLVGKRARTSLLVETVGAMTTLAECIAVPGVDEVHIGLNDLHLELKQSFMFEPLAEGLVDRMAATLNAAGMPFGIGGVARVGEGLLPAELILSEHARLGSSAAILSRTFHRQAATIEEITGEMDFALEIDKLRQAYSSHLDASTEQQEHMRALVAETIRHIASTMRARQSSNRSPLDRVYA